MVRRANATSKTRNTIYNEEGKLSQPESVSGEEVQAVISTAGDGSPTAPPSVESDGIPRTVPAPPPPPPKDDTLWRVSGENGSSASLKEGFRYLHKKFKKMEAPSSEDAENGDQDAVVDESVHANVREDVDDDPAESCSKPASNPSLEALFQVTGHELQKIKCSEEEVAQSPGSHAPSPGDASAPENGLLLLAPDERELGKRLRRHVCPYCGLACGKPSVLQKHVRAHTNERPYPCVPCGFAFKTKSNLYKHCKSRAHHLKVADGGAAVADVGDDADVIETDDSTNSDEDGVAEFVERMRTPDEIVASTSASAIYKPKFHSVAYLTASSRPRGSTEAAPEANADCIMTAADCIVTADDCIKRFALPAPLGTARNNGAVQKEGATVGLAKRRNEQFQLRLEIPGPRVACLPSLSSSSSASSSSSSSSAASTSSAATPLSAVTNRLPLPATAAGFPSPRHQRSPKLASPEYLQQHISNLISQNAAIVETLDPLWPRRYTRQSSVASSHNVDAELRSKERLRRLSEDAVVAPSQAKSKLALALLSATARPTSQSTSATATVEVLADAPYRPATVVAYRTPNKVAIVDDAASRRIPTPESDSGSIVKSLLMASGLNKTSSSSLSQSARPLETHHPQNPEGSIIKDLLLKTRPVATTPTATCMRLSGGSISTSSTAAVAPVDEPSSEGATAAGPYTCNLCHISYRKAENLEIHCAHYCQKGPRPQFATTPPPPPSPNVVETPPAGVTVILSATLDTASAIPVQPTGSIPVPKPRGRPRGSKNRPKYEAPPAVLAGRVHSKSVSESAVEPPSKEREAFRRNSISGELSDSIKDILMSRSLFGTDGAPPTDSIVVVPPSTTATTPTPLSADDGPILKKHLLAGGPEGDKSPPLKKRKIPEDALQADSSAPKKDVATVAPPTVLSLKSLEQLSRYPMRPSAVRLFGGEVQICDGAETKKIIIDHKMQSMLPSGGAGGSGSDAGLGGLQAADTTSSVVATIAKPVHNSGGTVLQVQEAKSAPPVCIPVVAVARPLMATGTPAAVLLSPAPVATVAIDISQLKLGPAPKPALPSIVLRPDAAKTPVLVRTSVTVADCTTSTSTTATDSNGASKRLEVPVIHIQDVPKTSAAEVTSTPATIATVTTTTTAVTKSLLALPRPTSLLLKNVHTSMAGMTLVSPETPRPKKKYGQCYLNGQYYTYLELKQSTRVYYCNCRPQPMYVPQSVDPKLSMYSMWQTVPADPDPFGLTPPQAMSLYASKPRYQAYAIAGAHKMPLVVTHSSYWTFQQKEKAAADGAKKSPGATSARHSQEENASETQELDSKSAEKSAVEGADGKTSESTERSSPIDNDEEVDVERTTPSPVGDPKQPKTDLSLKHRLKDSGSAVEPKRVRIFEGGFKSNEDYTYVRGRGRGKYVCEECGIRCKKPSMLKKHIRTHTDVRPYTCKHCNFSFKTKGNLTKHMKSKAHHKKCVVLGIVPVPVTIDDAQIDEEALARQERIEHQRKQFADDEDSMLEDDDDEDDEDEEEEDDEDEGHEEYKEGEDEDDESLELDGQFEDASETPGDNLEPPSGGSPKPHSEQEIAKSLLELGQTEPTLTSSASLVDIAPVMAREVIERPRSLECVGEPCDEREELIGNPRVVWSSSGRNLPEVAPSSSGPSDHLVRTMDIDVEADEYPVRPVQCLEPMDEDDDESEFASRPLQRTDKEGARSALYLSSVTTLAAEETDQPMDLSMPHSRPEDGYDDVLEEDRPKRIDEGGATDLHTLNPYYNAPPPQFAPEPERHRGSSPRCYENISPAGSVELHRQLPLPAHSPYQPAAPPIEPVRDWTSKPPTPPPPPPSRPSVLHTYLSEQPPSKRMAMAAPPRGGSSRRHRTSSTSSACVGRKSPTLYPSPAMFGFASTAASPPPLPPPSSARAESPPEILSPVGLPDGLPSRGPPSVGISNLAMYIHRSMDDGKCICTICNKAFSKPSHLRLHVNIHYFERPFRCDSCAISFRTKGHLQKHKRSVSHYNKVNMNMTFGTPTTDNPRPFKCEDCKIAFRIHGHLAKHLRSKMHIMKLECLGKLPFGTYAEIERSGANLNEIDTTDCENSLESLQVMAHRLVEKDPTVQRWPRERTISGGSCDDQSDGLPYVESPVGSGGGVAAPSAGHYRSQSVGDDGCVSPDFADAGRLVMWSQRPFESNLPPSPDSGGAVPLPGIKLEPAEGSDIPHLVDPRPGTVATVGTARRQDGAVRLELGQRTPSSGSLVQDYEDISDDDESEAESPRRGGAVCRICGEVVKSAKFLQLHMYINHVDGGSVPKTSEEFPPTPTVGVARKLSSPPLAPPTATSPSWRLPAYSTLPASITTAAAVIEEQDYVCELCSEVYPNGHTLKQHMMMHARLRPYICELCDAGFTTSHYLKLHLQTHQQGKVFACQECHQSFGMIEELERHVDHVHPSLDGEQVR